MANAQARVMEVGLSVGFCNGVRQYFFEKYSTFGKESFM
jgi:hypothetical protein